MNQTTSHILMIRPASFGFNEQTAESNAFQQDNGTVQQAQQQALQEFEAFAALLQSKDIDVTVVDDTTEPRKPDAIFPNNWISFHNTGDVFMYPMQAKNRRLERREDVVRNLEKHFQVNHLIDLSRFELENKFLEGTGSMVLDRENKIAYVCLSPRSNTDVLTAFCKHLQYTAVTFNATDAQLMPIYHTNVMMCVGSKFAVVCLDSILNKNEKQAVIKSLQDTDKKMITITMEQMNQFAGNMLEVSSKIGQKILIMSQSAYRSLKEVQVKALEQYTEIVWADLTTIETIGGGSARCMIAEVHLPKINN